MFLLPKPEHAIDEAMVEEKDRIQPSRVVLAHVPVRARNRRVIHDLRQVVAADRQVDRIMRALKGDHRLARDVVPFLLRGRIREHRVVWGLQTAGVLVVDAVVADRCAINNDRRGQPVDDVRVEQLNVARRVGVQSIVGGGCSLVGLGSDQARQRISYRLVPDRLAVVGVRERAEMINDLSIEDEGLQRVWNLLAVERVRFIGKGPGHALRHSFGTGLIPIGKRHVGTPGDAAQRVLQPQQINPVPSRK